jgi:hypothetical protein
MYGTVDISANVDAAISIDGKQYPDPAPIIIEDLLVGEHEVTLTASGYKPFRKKIEIVEGKTATINATMEEGASSVQPAAPVPVAEAVPVGRDVARNVSTAPTAGLVAYYPFNGSAKDESGNGNNPTTLTDVTLTSDRFGNANSAYSFNGSSSRMIVPNSNSLNITGTSITISFWMLWKNSGQSYIGISKGGCDPHNGYEFVIRNDISWITGDKGGGGLTVFTGGHTQDNANNYCGREFNTIKYRNGGLWCHFVATFNNGQVIEYINGVRDFSISLRGSNIVGSDHSLYIGSRDPANNYAGVLNGKIDDIRIYNRALSSDEVNQLYNEK